MLGGREESLHLEGCRIAVSSSVVSSVLLLFFELLGPPGRFEQRARCAGYRGGQVRRKLNHRQLHQRYPLDSCVRRSCRRHTGIRGEATRYFSKYSSPVRWMNILNVSDCLGQTCNLVHFMITLNLQLLLSEASIKVLYISLQGAEGSASV